MKTRPLYDFSDDFQNNSFSDDELLDQEDGLYDDNWIVSAGDLFNEMDIPLNEYNPYQNQAA